MFSKNVTGRDGKVGSRRQARFVGTLEEAESDPIYEEDPDVGMHDAGTLLDQWMQVKQIKDPAHEEKPYKQLESLCQ